MLPAADLDPDLALLRTYEPVLRYTAGELFLPTAVGPYLARCSLWADDGGSRRKRRVEELVPPGELTPDGLAAAGIRHRGRPLYLRFVQEQLSRADVAAWRREDRPRLRGKARFAAVGVLARLIDAFVRLSLLVRGRVPGGLVAAAHRLAAAALAQAGEAPDRGGSVRTAYGRVLRPAGTRCCSTGTSTRSTTGARRSTGSTTTRPTGRRSRSTWSRTGTTAWHRRGSARRRTTSRARTCGVAGTTRSCAARATTR